MLATDCLPINEKIWNNMYISSQGSDPRLATCRGKLQNQRAKINQDINKQIMIRNGAENLFKASTNKKLRETVALELSFVNSSLQLLKEQLAELNSSVNIYQGKSTPQLVPMIPLGLKETKPIDFTDSFKDFILEHYSEESSKYENAIKEFMDIRQAVRTPTRDESGIHLLFGYYNLLYLIDRRFFPPHRHMGIFFEWFDSLTGVPSTQKTIAFEKASILFNIAALYTQLAAKQDRISAAGVDAAVDNFLRAAGMFRYVRDNFSNAPSMDLSPATLDTLINLMLAQARECLFEKLVPVTENLGLKICLEVAQEASEVSSVYSNVHRIMSGTSVKDYVPYSWISLALVKSKHYSALAHHYASIGLLEHNGELNKEMENLLEFAHLTDNNNSSTFIDIIVPKNTEEKRQLGKAHLRESLLTHEEALRLHALSRQLRRIDHLRDKLRTAHDASQRLYDGCEQEDDFREILDPPAIAPATKYQLTLMPPDFTEHKVKDLFHDLGPLRVFSARRHWTVARLITLRKKAEENFGFSVRGDSPVIVAAVDARSLAQEAGMKVGDFIVLIGETDAKWLGHEEVVCRIKESGNTLQLKVVTPLDHDYLLRQTASVPPLTSTLSTGGTSMTSTLGGGLSRVKLRSNPFGGGDKRRRNTWNFFRRSQSKDREFPVILSSTKDKNVSYR